MTIDDHDPPKGSVLLVVDQPVLAPVIQLALARPVYDAGRRHDHGG